MNAGVFFGENPASRDLAVVPAAVDRRRVPFRDWRRALVGRCKIRLCCTPHGHCLKAAERALQQQRAVGMSFSALLRR
jgi:hypothetical protein